MNHDPQKRFMKDKSSSKASKGPEESEKDASPQGADADVAAIEQAALTRVAAGRTGKRDAATVKLNPAFDSWLEGKLHRIFDKASTEPLPQDLLGLLDKIDQAEAARKDKKVD
jgi:hypothetical protein